MDSVSETSLSKKSKETDSKPTDLKFSSTLTTYMSLLGYSVGMSDIWRFPFLSYRNGGGAFLIPFVFTIGICGVPLYFLEYSMGKFSGKSVHNIWDICPLFRGISVSITIAYPLFFMGNTVFRCWLIEFLIHAFQDPLPWTHCNNDWNTKSCLDNQFSNNSDNASTAHISNNDVITTVDPISANHTFGLDPFLENTTGLKMTATEEFWQYKVLELSSGISDLSPIQWRYVLMIFIFRILIFCCLIKSIKSFEKIIFVTTLVPFILTVVVFIRSLLLPGAGDGLYHFFYPDFSKLSEPRIWIEAALMAFYTLGFGWGSILTIGSHARFNENCLRSSVILPIVDAFMAIFSGMVCFSVLGNLAHTYNVEITEVINAGMSTGVIAYITALSALPLPQLWIVFFIVSTVLTAFDGQMIPVDMVVQIVCEMFPRLLPRYRIHTLAAFSIILFLGSLPTCTGAGAYIFLWIDWYSGAWIGFIVTMIEMFVVSWTYGFDRFSNDIYMMIGKPIPAIMRIVMNFITPVVIAAIFITSCADYLPPKYGSYHYPLWVRWFGWVSVLIILLPIAGYAVFIIARGKGSLLKRLQHLLKPLDTWEPCEDPKKDEFHEKKLKYKNRSKKDLLYYNIFGRYPTNSNFSAIPEQEEEMVWLDQK